MATLTEYANATERLEQGELTFAPSLWAEIDKYGEMSMTIRLAYEAGMTRREISRAQWQPWAKPEAQALCDRLSLVEAGANVGAEEQGR
jgi:hypothetical protein